MTTPELALCIVAVTSASRLFIEVVRFILERIAEREAARWRNLGALGAGAAADLFARFMGDQAGATRPDTRPDGKW